MASRALKLAPRINRSTFTADWQLFTYFVQESAVDLSVIIRHVPFLLDSDLRSTYLAEYERHKSDFTSLDRVKETLQAIAGTTSISCDDFRYRVWQMDTETVTAFMFGLQDMASKLRLPDDMVRSQFLSGLPNELSLEIRGLNVSVLSCAELAATAERLLKKGKPVVGLNAIQSSPAESELSALAKEVAALKLQIQRTGKCYRCGKAGHFARSCGNSSSSSGTESRIVRCFRCGKPNHISKYCPKN
jgi:hypothetical protein